MSDTFGDYEAIHKVLEDYIEGNLKGKSEIMKKSFRPEAIMYGHMHGKFSGGPIQALYDAVDGGPPAKDLKAEIISIQVEEKIANARVELSNANGFRFSDMFLLAKDGGEWKILSKIFYTHE